MSRLASLRSTHGKSSYLALALLLGALAPSAGCKIFKSTCDEDDRTCLGGGYQRSGGECTRNGDCALGLECVEDKCEYTAATKKGSECRATAECGKGLYCSKDVKCEPISDDAQPVGGSCGSSADCEKGLACDLEVKTLFTEGPFGDLDEECQGLAMSADLPEQCKLPKKCVARGKKDTGDKCSKSAECLAGLYCVPNLLDPKAGSICGRSPEAMEQELISLPSWDGNKCPADADDATAYFEVPRSSGKNKDFYRLPFPNDIRIKADGKIDLSGHPVPPSDLDVPVVERFINAAGESLTGFGTNPVVFFRFSEPYNTGKGQIQASVHLVNITKGSPLYGRPSGLDWGPSGPSSHYICPNWIGLRPPIGSPLPGNSTYVAYLTRTLKTNKDKAFARSPDLDAMLSDTAPSDADLATAYGKYAPLRAWLKDSETDPDSILNAAVFTTQNPEDPMLALHTAVAKEGAPKLSKMVVCDTGVKLPECEDEIGRGACHAANKDFTEIHGLVSLPIFQKGTPPYETPEQGGAIVLDAKNVAQKQSNMQVCFALSVPKTAMPAKGYPVILYAHGTGGSFVGQMASGGLATDAAKSPTPTAVLAIDMPEHGNRRGESKRPPEDLFFNFANPEGARGNVLQGSADMLSLALLVQGAGIAKNDSPTDAAIKFDGSRVVAYGHSQGATHTAVMLPFEAGVQAGILSGVGGHLATSLINKKKPVDIASILPFVLFDADDKGKLVAGLFNPMLAIVQMFYESADPINYGARIHESPADTAPTGHHVFMTYGLNDSFSPEKTQEAYALSAKLTLVEPELTGIDVPKGVAPLGGNQTVAMTPRTVGMRQYDPTVGAVGGVPSDGHFVASQTEQGREDVLRFIRAVTAGDVPQIGQ